MTRVHDMGGRFGDGPVDASDGATFAKEWHARALAVTLSVGAFGKWNIDASRHSRETLAPKDYSRFSYYEKWLAALADQLVKHDIVTEEELGTGRGMGVSDLAARAWTPQDVGPTLSRGSPYSRETDVAQRFAVGDRVRTRRPSRNTFVEGGHTRLPAYAAGAVGTVVMCHGAHVFPDSNAHGLGEAAQPLYAVAITAQELWGAGAEGDEVILDLWQSYLGPA